LALWTILNALQHRFAGEQSGHMALSRLLPPLFELSRIILLFKLIRSLLAGETNRIRAIWAVLSFLFWVALGFSIWHLLNVYSGPIVQWVLGTFVVPALFIPVAAASTHWGIRLLWRRVLEVLRNGYWWIATLATVVIGDSISNLIVSMAPIERPASEGWGSGMLHITAFLWSMGCFVLLICWVTVLLGHQQPHSDKTAKQIIGKAELEGEEKPPSPQSD